MNFFYVRCVYQYVDRREDKFMALDEYDLHVKPKKQSQTIQARLERKKRKLQKQQERVRKQIRLVEAKST